MDNFNIDFTQNFIKNADHKLMDEMDNITFEYNRLSKEGSKLLQILNYSPKISKLDINQIKNIPKISIPQLSELKILNYSITNQTTNKKISTKNSTKNEIEDMIKRLLYSIIDNILEKNNIDHIKFMKTEEDEEEEEFKKIMFKNKKKSDAEERKRDNEFTIAASRIGLEMNLLNQIKVYLFNNNDYILINITPKDKIKSIKEKIIRKILDSNKYKLKNTSEEAYEIRLINEGEKDKLIIGSYPLENNESLFKEKINSIAFLEKNNYISEHINEEELKLEEDDQDKINVKIYYKKNGIKTSKYLVLSKEDNLKNILNIFFEENLLKNKELDQYYFVEHNAIQDIENEINLDTNIKYLPSYELNLCTKNYYELPEMINEYNIDVKKNLFNDKKSDNNIKGFNNSRFNEISAGLYQEFEVTKINKYNNKKKRILGIDMYNLYNNLPKKNNNGIINIIFKETKNPIRKIENIKECIAVGKIGFYIDIKEENNIEKIKTLKYEAKNSDKRDEIVDKINFLINYHKIN